MKRHSCNDKRPRPHAEPKRQHFYYNIRKGSYKPKKAFPDEQSARNFLHTHYVDGIYGSVYLCPFCNQWHISTRGIREHYEDK